MKSEEDILEIVANAKDRGVTLTEITDGSRKKKDTTPVKETLEKLKEAGKVVRKSNGRYYLAGIKPTLRRKNKNYVTREELEGIINEVYRDIAFLKEKIDRAYEYVDEVFLHLKDNKQVSTKLPTREEMLIAYDNVNIRENAGGSVPIPDFKRELKKMGFRFNEEEINKKLLEMDKSKIIYLQEANNPEELEEKEQGIKTDRGLLFYITWIKRS